MTSRACSPSAARQGFTLLEMSAVIGSLAIVLLLIAAILLGVFNTQQLSTRVSHTLMTQNTLGDQFRSDVATATGAPKMLGDEQAGPNCLILQRTDGSHVVYRWHEGKLDRSEVVEDNHATQTLPVGNEQTTVEFLRGDGDRLLTLRLADSPERVKQGRMVEYSAALGGDLR